LLLEIIALKILLLTIIIPVPEHPGFKPLPVTIAGNGSGRFEEAALQHLILAR
jgi:hypothetical protein